jgi:hypothetical protein
MKDTPEGDVPENDTTDGALERVRAARHRISEQVAHDPRALVNRYTELQKQYANRLLTAEQEPKASKT